MTTTNNEQARASRRLLDISNAVAAFSEEQVERITGLGKGRLRYWAKTGFFVPSLAEQNPKLPWNRFYSFKDIVALRALETLRVRHGVTPQRLRKAAEKLSRLEDELWAKTTLFVLDKRVEFVNPETGRPGGAMSGEYLYEISLKTIMEDTTMQIVALTERRSADFGRLSRHRGVNHNGWVVSGTRIPVAAIQRLHEDGLDVDAIIDEYPSLTKDDVEAALEHDHSKVA